MPTTSALLLAAAAAASLTSALPTNASTNPPVITLPTSNLSIHGFTNTTASPHVAQYLSIPYASPPVGSLRWAPPQPYNASAAVVNATALPPSCWQYVSTQPGVLRTDAPEFMIDPAGAGMSEDCLKVSVWTPREAVEEGKELPVLVWFYGGGFATGGTDVPYQDPETWVERGGGHVVVVFNYRLNIFGFPNAGGLDDEEQNLGLMDQRFAVEWIRDNIAHFGGNASQITIWGQSAGAVAVDYYNFAHAADPIVAGLIMDSGTAHLNQLLSSDTPHSNFSFVAAGLGCGNLTSSPSTELACMRDVPAWKIEKFVATYEDSGAAPGITFSPVIDEKWVFGNYTARAANGDISDVPAIIGFNAAEGLFLAPYSADGPNQTVADTLSHEYFWCPATKTTLERLAADRPTHRYFYAGNFTNVSPRPWLGAYHSSELPLLFGTHGDFRGASSAFEQDVSVAMQDAWVAFARDPVGGLESVGWPAYGGAGGEVREFAVGEVVVGTGEVGAIEEECARRGLL